MSKFNNGGKPTKRVAVAIFRVAGRMANENRSPIPGASIDDIFRRLDPNGTGMLSKDGVREALSQLGLDASAEAVNQIFRTAGKDIQTSPKSFQNLVGRMKQERTNADAQVMSIMKHQHEQALASEQSKHRQEMEALVRRKDAEARAIGHAMQAATSPGGTSTALVPIDNMSRSGLAPSSPTRRSSPSMYTYTGAPSSSAKKKTTYGFQGSDPSPTGFMSPVTYNRKFNQIVHEMEVQSQVKVDEALRDQRDRHADALERVVAEKEAETALRLSELSRELEAKHSNDMGRKVTETLRAAENERVQMLQTESAKIDELLGEAEIFKVQSEADMVEKTESFKQLLASQLQEQRDNHTEELRRALLEAEGRGSSLRDTVIAEKDKQFASEKDELETRLRQQAATDLELQRKRFEASLAEELGKQAKELKSAASSEQESKLLDVAAAHASKVANVEAAQELAKTEALSAALQKAREEYDLKAEALRLELTQSFEEARSKDLERCNSSADERQATAMERAHAEHRAQLAAQLANAERDHGQRLREQTAMLQEQHTKNIEAALDQKEEAHKRILAETLTGRDAEHQKMLDAALKKQETHHVQRTQLLLQQHEKAGVARTTDLLSSKSTDHEEHLLAVKDELTKCHHQNLERELTHQRDTLRKQHNEETAALEKRLEAKRESELADQAKRKDDQAAEAAALVSAEHNAAIAALEADWMARREDAVKISARNLHDMHQEALRKALFDKDAAHEEALEKMIAEKDAHHVEIMQQLASQRDEEHHHRLAAELEKCDAEHRAIMDQLVKEKLDADKSYRDEVLDLKEHIAQLETKLHVDKTSAELDVRRHGDRLTKFCQWTSDQALPVAVQTTLGQFKAGSLETLDPGTGTASVIFEDGSKESEVILSRVTITPKPSSIAPGIVPGTTSINAFSSPADVLHAAQTMPAPGEVAVEAASSTPQPSSDLMGVLKSMSKQEQTLLVFLPLVVFPAVVVLLAVVLSLVYAAE